MLFLPVFYFLFLLSFVLSPWRTLCNEDHSERTSHVSKGLCSFVPVEFIVNLQSNTLMFHNSLSLQRTQQPLKAFGLRGEECRIQIRCLFLPLSKAENVSHFPVFPESPANE